MKKLVLAALAALALAAPQVASASITALDPTLGGTPATLANSLMTNPGELSSAQLPEYPDEGEDEFGGDASAVGYGDSSAEPAPKSLAGFPTNGSTYTILSTGGVEEIGKVLNNESEETTTTYENQIDAQNRGLGAEDWTVLKLAVVVPAGTNCLSLDYRFFSEEFPEFVGSSYNDAFFAELNASTWSIGEVGEISRPNDFAVDPSGTPISVNGVGPAAVNAEQAAGTYFDAATGLVTTKTAVSPGLQTVYLSITDAGDSKYDSAVFLDNLHFINESPETCKPPVGALLVIPAPGAPAPPNNVFGLGPKVKFKKGNTEVVITINVPGPGVVAAASPGAAASSSRSGATTSAKKGKGKGKGKKGPVLTPSSVTAAAAGPVSIGVKLSAAGKAKLNKTGKVVAPVQITFTPTGGAPSVQTKKVTFKKPGKHKGKGKGKK